MAEMHRAQGLKLAGDLSSKAADSVRSSSSSSRRDIQAPSLVPRASAEPGKDGLSPELVQKIIRQVEFYFSDTNLATTEHLMRFVSKDPEGFVPISVFSSYKKIKSLVNNTTFLADALRTSSKLDVSEDGKKVRRQQPITKTDVAELQSRIIVAENLPKDHCFQSLMKIFSAVGSVKAIRTCYPQASLPSRSGKMDILFGNKMHAFVEYETNDHAEKAVAELNDERNWRTGLRVRLLNRCMNNHELGQAIKGGYEGASNVKYGDFSTSNHPCEKQVDNLSQLSDEHARIETNNKEAAVRLSNAHSRGGRGRGHYQSFSRRSSHAIGAPSNHLLGSEQPTISKQPPGPRMPDGTRGFTMGRGKPTPPSA